MLHFRAEGSIAQLRQLLVFVLACAVQCERRERYITRIRTMAPHHQLELMAAIQVCLPFPPRGAAGC